MQKVIKIIGLNMGIVVFNIILFSPGLLGVQIGGVSILATAFGATVMVMSGVVFILGNYKILIQRESIIQVKEIKTAVDYINALEQNSRKKTFTQDISTVLQQIQRFQKKKETIRNILLQKFNSDEMSYSKFESVITEVESLLYINIKSIINKLNAFDEEDYNHIRKDSAQTKFSKEVIQAKMSIYDEYIFFIKDSLEDNEQIILKLDQLLLEISKFNSLEDGEIENMNAMKEIDELINRAKFYK